MPAPRTTTLLATAGLVLTLGAGLTAAPAGARTIGASAEEEPTAIRAVDGRHDMFVFREKRNGDESRHRARGHKAGDVTSVRVRQTARAVVVRFRMARLASRRGFGFGPIALIRTPQPSFVVYSFFQGVDGEVSVGTASSGQEILCPGAVATVRPAVRGVSMTVPRECLNNPRWVRVKGVSYDFGRADRESDGYFVDVAPGRKLRIKGTTKRAYAPAGSVLGPAGPARLLPGPVATHGLPAGVRDLLLGG